MASHMPFRDLFYGSKVNDQMHDDYLQILLYEEAIQMAAVKRFHIYEGGEGKLTKQHAWMHVLSPASFPRGKPWRSRASALSKDFHGERISTRMPVHCDVGKR